MKLNKIVFILSFLAMTNFYNNDLQAKNIKKATIQNSANLIRQAEEKIDELEYDKAISLLKAVPKNDKLSSKSSLLLGKLYISTFAIDIKEVKDDLEEDIDYLKDYLNKASIELKKVSPQEKELKENLNLLDTMYGLYYHQVAIRQIYYGEYEESIKNLDLAKKYVPDEVRVYSDKAVAYAKLGDFNNALKNSYIALDDNPHSSYANYSMARIYSLMEDNQSAFKSLKKSIILDEELKEQAMDEEDFIDIMDSEEFDKLVY